MGASVVYVGNLPGDVLEKEVEDIFYKYGNIKRVSIKPGEAGGMPAFCFVEFDHPDDAYDAVKALDGREKLGKRLRVEISKGGRRDRDDYSRGGGGRDYGGDRFRDDRRRVNPRPYNTAFRVVVSGLPPTASWQDLKDHMRKGGEVTFAQVVRDGDGVLGLVDYATSDDMATAIKRLDDTEFKNPYDKSYIRVKEDTRPRGDDRGGDRRGKEDRYEARRSPSRSPRSGNVEARGRDDRGRSRSRSLSRGRAKDRSRS
jgi:arginine/serine-rich splicing factor 1/9